MAKLGEVLNKEIAEKYSQVWDVAAETKIADGDLVYLDNTLGAKKAPTDGTVHAKRIWFCSVGADNSATGTAKGDKKITVYKKGARVVGKAQGTITEHAFCRASQTTAGTFQSLAVPGNSTTPTAAEVDAIRNFVRDLLATFVGKPLEGVERGKDPADVTDTNLGVFDLE